MRASFISFGSFYRDAGGQLTSDTASARYRALHPAEYLARRGHDIQVVATNEDFWRHAEYMQIAGEAVVFVKSFDARNELLAQALRQAGRRVVFDICDNHFEHPQLGGHFRRMIDLSDEVVASTKAMAEVVRQVCGRAARVIGDPVETKRCPTRFEPGGSGLKTLWFGHPVNFDTLRAVIPDLHRAATQRSVHLTVVTAPVDGLPAVLEQWSRPQPASFRAQFVPWSVAELERQLAACDLVVIPSLSDDRKSVKSPNRLTETLWAGRLAVAYPLPSYLEFSDYVKITTDFAGSLQSVLEYPADIAARISAGQNYVAAHYSREAVGRQWEALILGAQSPGPT